MDVSCPFLCSPEFVATRAGTYPLTPLQEALLLETARDGALGTNIEQVLGRFEERLDENVLRLACECVAKRHESLRTLLCREADGSMVGEVRGDFTLAWATLDWRECQDAGHEERLRHWLSEDRRRGFADEAAVPSRFTLIRIAPDLEWLVWTVHHALVDGRSMARVVREILATYDTVRAGGEGVAGIAPAFSVYAGRLQNARGEAGRAGWMAAFDGAPGASPLPMGKPGTETVEAAGQHATVSRRLGREAVEGIVSWAEDQGLNLHTLVQAAWAWVLARYTGSDETIFGETVSLRPRDDSEADRVVGPWIHTLPVRARVQPDAQVLEWLRGIREHWRSARRRPAASMSQIQRWLGWPGDQPLFRTLVVFENRPELSLARVVGDGGRTRRFDLVERCGFALSLSVLHAEGLESSIEYDSARYEGGFVEQLLRDWELALTGFRTNADQCLGDFEITDRAGWERIRAWMQGSELRVPEWTVVEGVDGMVRKFPKVTAVEDGGKKLSYRKLSAASEALACALRSRGVGPERRVVLVAERSVDLVVGLLGILRAGGVVVPLDPDLPPARAAAMVEDAAPWGFCIADHAKDRCPSTDLPTVSIGIFLEHDGIESEEGKPASMLEASLAACVLYTSGSTGRPKGVILDHGALASYLGSAAADLGLGVGDRVLQFASPVFDVYLEEVFVTLLRGATLVIRPRDWLGTVHGFLAFCVDQRLTVLDLPTAFWHEWMGEWERAAYPWPDTVRLVLIGGEAARAGALEVWGRRVPRTVRLVNAYGPAEATIAATWAELTTLDLAEAAGVVPIGRPRPGIDAWVVDRWDHPCPIGVPGELLLGGPQLARGYVGADRGTEERFVRIGKGWAENRRLYRTGDIVRVLDDGQLQFLGRRDEQLKVRGHRVEVGEVESLLVRHPAIREAAIVAREHPARGWEMVAHVVPRSGGEISTNAIRSALRQHLPDAMIPSAFVVWDRLPRTTSQKMDRQALKNSGRPEIGWACVGEAPRTASERQLAGIWCRLLGIAEVGPGLDFFSAGGHSLLGMQLAAEVSREWNVSLTYPTILRHRTLEALALWVDTNRSGVRDRIPRATRDSPFRLSREQERLWILQHRLPDPSTYHVPLRLKVSGPLDWDRLDRSLGVLAARHEMLRVRVDESGGNPVMEVLKEPWAYLRVIDWRAAGNEEASKRLAVEVDREFRRPLGGTSEPLWRVLGIRLSEWETELLVTFHHLICDEWSVRLWFEEWERVYGAGGLDPGLPELPIRYVDYAAWQREYLDRPERQVERDYWRDALRGAVFAIPFPEPMHVGDGGASASVESLSWEGAPELREGVEVLAKTLGTTPGVVMLAAFGDLLARFAGQEDLVVGMPLAHRERPEVQGLFGLLLNIVPIRLRARRELSFRELVGQMRESVSGAVEHGILPLDSILQEATSGQPSTDQSGENGIRAVLVWLDAQPAAPVWGEACSAWVPVKPWAPRFDLTLFASWLPDGRWVLTWEYDTRRFDPDTIERLAEQFATLLRCGIGNAETKLGALNWLPDDQARQVMAWAKGGCSEEATSTTLTARFREMAQRFADSEAVRDGETSLSYAELDRISSEIASFFRTHGLGRGEVVGVDLERSAEGIIVALAILKAGGIYLPLPRNHPAERLRRMLVEARAGWVVGNTDSKPSMLPEEVRFHTIGDLRESSQQEEWDANLPDSPACVMFTSGSTGEPKGVLVPHRSVVRLVVGTDYVEWGPARRILAIASTAFDASLFEIWGALLHGGTCVIHREAIPTPDGLGRSIRELGADCVLLTAALFNEVVDRCPEVLRPIRYLVTGGEAMSMAHARRALEALPETQIVNAYGPTEGGVIATAYTLPRGDALGRSSSVPLGRPLSHTRCHVLDAQLRPLPVGVAGELCIGGEGVALGYVNRPDLTEDRFRPDPFGDRHGGRLYRTGDRARFRSDGSLEFLGRLDNQLKIRGFRVEPGEIESALETHPEVGQVAVVVRGSSEADRRLVGCVVAKEGKLLRAAELRAHLAMRLPEYMLPSRFAILDELPRTVHGKLDRRALERLELEEVAAERPFEAPSTSTETAIASIWAELLRLERVGRQDDFFMLGGHSLMAMQVLARLRARFASEVGLATLFRARTLSALASEVERPDIGRPGPRPGDEGESAAIEAAQLASYEQARLWFLHQLTPDDPAYHLPFGIRFLGRVEEGLLRGAVGDVVGRHASLRMSFHAGEGEPMQIVHRQVEVPWETVDAEGVLLEAREDWLARETEAWLRRPFDLGAAPLMRVRWVRWADEDSMLQITWHHMVGDGWSIAIFLRELEARYASRMRGEVSAPEPLALDYPDYARARRERLAGERLEERIAFWRERLMGAPSRLELPRDGRPGENREWCGGDEPIVRRLSVDDSKALTDWARGQGATPFMVILAAWGTLLGRLAGTDDVVVGTPVASRDRVEWEKVIGLFLNTLPLRVRRSGGDTLESLVQRVRDETVSALTNQDLPFEKLVEALRPERSTEHTPVFQVFLNYAPPEVELTERWAGGLRTELVFPRLPDAKFDLTLYVRPRADGLEFELLPRRDLYSRERTEGVLEQLLGLVRQGIATPETPLEGLSLITPAHHAWMADPTMPLEATVFPSLPEAFETQVRVSGERTAIECEGRRWSYAELERRSREIAWALLGAGIAARDAVAVSGYRSFGLVAALLGVLRAGAVLLPLDPHLPVARQRRMIETSGMRACLMVGLETVAETPAGSGAGQTWLSVDPETGEVTAWKESMIRDSRVRAMEWAMGGDAASAVEREARRSVPAHEPDEIGCGVSPQKQQGWGPNRQSRDGSATLVRFMAREPFKKEQAASHEPEAADSLPRVTAESPAYLFFTSGTTGIPKAVLGVHGGLAHFLHWQKETFGIGPGDRAAQVTGLSFDVVLRDIFTPLISGATLVLPKDPATLVSQAMIPWLKRQACTLFHAVPSLVETWLQGGMDGPRLDQLRWVFLAGEPLHDGLVRRWRARVGDQGRIVNLYGPTETTLAKCWYAVPEHLVPGIQPVGRPMPGAQVLLLNSAGKRCGAGEPGEIVIRTPFRTLGYLRGSEETQHRFVPNPFRTDAGDVVYHSGDLGRFQPDGVLQILGRRDDQVKIRGVRVELGEVVTALEGDSRIRSAVVLVRELASGLKELVAFVVVVDAVPDLERQMRSRLIGILPAAAVPSRIHVLDRLPLTPNGKVDREGLLAWGADREKTASDPLHQPQSIEPITERQERLRRIWAELLNRPDLGIHDDFFESGGHSLLALQLVSKVQQAVGTTLTLRSVFNSRTVSEMDALLARLEMSGEAEGRKGRRLRGAARGVPLFEVPGYFGLGYLRPSIASAIAEIGPYYDGLRYAGVEDDARPMDTIEAIAAHLVRQIQELWPPGSGPLCLCGFSFGGTVAFEVACQLVAQNQPVSRLLLYDSRLGDGHRIRSHGEVLLELLRRARRQPRGQRAVYLIRMIRDKIRSLFRTDPVDEALRKLGTSIAKGQDDGPDCCARELPGDVAPEVGSTGLLKESVRIASAMAGERFRPRPYGGRVTLFKAKHLVANEWIRRELDPLNGWGAYVTGRLETVLVPREHLGIYTEPLHPLVIRRTVEILLEAKAGH